MDRIKSFRPLFGLALIMLCGVSSVYASDHAGGRHERHRPAHPVFRDPNWVLDARFHHDHYYPRVGYTLSILPPGYLNIGFHDRHFFFNAGVWFAREGPRYVVVTPPVGVTIPLLPPAYTTIWIGATPYYYANGIYYAPAGSGYVTVAPPPGYEDAALAPPPPPAPPSPAEVGEPAPPADDLLFVIPLRDQSDAIIASDRTECSRIGVEQTGYDPAHASVGDPRRGDYLRAVSTCLEQRGYRVK